jgi:arylsulfatase A-like enzyme
MAIFRPATIFLSILLLFSCKYRKQAEREVKNIAARPNVILVMTDDQGIGDLGAHGNPWIKTPNIDRFYEESVRLTDFHVSPLCTPTRSAIMTGVYPIKNGTWATFKGRDMLHASLPIMPEIFKQNGYATAMFGKWHLGNNYPSRPTDKGFDYAIHHSSGGVGELSDYWGNNYFDDTYLVNNEPQQFEGYCTDVWFNEAIKYIKANKDEPFFIYLPTNAPHDPLYVDKKYSDPYEHLEGQKIYKAKYYGMLANIDENFGKLNDFLKNEGLDDNTILIYCSDNGSRFGVSPDYKLGWNKGFRGLKSDKLEGGHRVPFFIRWPNANMIGGNEISELTNHVDLVPTLAGLCDLKLPENFDGDGVDFSDLLLSKKQNLDERISFIHHRQDYRQPKPIEGSCIMRGDWRLLNGNELYDIRKDPKQQNNIAQNHPEIVSELLKANEDFIAAVITKKTYQEYAYNAVGTEQNKITLTVQHAIGDDGPIWKQEEIAAGKKNKNATHPIQIGQKGKYRISCMRWPEENGGPIQGIPKINPKGLFDYKRINPKKARITLFGKTSEKDITAEDEKVVFELELEEGNTLMDAHFIEGDQAYGVYYIYVEKV